MLFSFIFTVYSLSPIGVNERIIIRLEKEKKEMCPFSIHPSGLSPFFHSVQDILRMAKGIHKHIFICTSSKYQF